MDNVKNKINPKNLGHVASFYWIDFFSPSLRTFSSLCFVLPLWIFFHSLFPLPFPTPFSHPLPKTVFLFFFPFLHLNCKVSFFSLFSSTFFFSLFHPLNPPFFSPSPCLFSSVRKNKPPPPCPAVFPPLPPG